MSGGEKGAPAGCPILRGILKKRLSYLNSSCRTERNTLKQNRESRGDVKSVLQRKMYKRREEGKVGSSVPHSVHTKITTRKDDPPYGILKGGKKPLVF